MPLGWCHRSNPTSPRPPPPPPCWALTSNRCLRSGSPRRRCHRICPATSRHHCLLRRRRRRRHRRRLHRPPRCRPCRCRPRPPRRPQPHRRPHARIPIMGRRTVGARRAQTTEWNSQSHFVGLTMTETSQLKSCAAHATVAVRSTRLRRVHRRLFFRPCRRRLPPARRHRQRAPRAIAPTAPALSLGRMAPGATITLATQHNAACTTTTTSPLE